MTKIAMIPARYASTRFPAKLLQLLGEMPVIQHTWQNTVATGLFDAVYVVTDHEAIASIIRDAGGRVIMSRGMHDSGTDRIAEAAAELEADVILNVQGDEPFIDRASLASLLDVFETDTTVQVGSLYAVIQEAERVASPNVVKVVLDQRGNALYFSRSFIPYQRDPEPPAVYFEHIGIYAFRKAALLHFTQLSPSPAELTEKIECLRFLEHGISLRMVEAQTLPVKIDVPADLEAARAWLKNA